MKNISLLPFYQVFFSLNVTSFHSSINFRTNLNTLYFFFCHGKWKKKKLLLNTTRITLANLNSLFKQNSQTQRQSKNRYHYPLTYVFSPSFLFLPPSLSCYIFLVFPFFHYSASLRYSSSFSLILPDRNSRFAEHVNCHLHYIINCNGQWVVLLLQNCLLVFQQKWMFGLKFYEEIDFFRFL